MIMIMIMIIIIIIMMMIMMVVMMMMIIPFVTKFANRFVYGTNVLFCLYFDVHFCSKASYIEKNSIPSAVPQIQFAYDYQII